MLQFNNTRAVDFFVVQVLSALNLYRFILISESTGKIKLFGIIDLDAV